jgi:hypothetical protein
MRLPRFDVIFSLAAPAIDIVVNDTGVAEFQVRDDKTCVGPFRADFDAGDDPLDAAPARGAVEEFLEAAELAVLRRGLEARLRLGFEALDMPAQCRGRRDAQDVIDAVGPTPVEHFRAAIMTSPRNRIWTRGQLARIARSKRRRKGRISLPPGRLAGRSTAVMKRPSPSNTTIGWKPYSS